MMTDINESIKKQLLSLSDADYRAFHSRLIPNADPSSIIGVRVPELRKLARQLTKEPDIDDFLRALPHEYYEENNIHAFVIEQIKDYNRLINELNDFLPYIDNWATCDCLSPKVFAEHKDELYEQILIWLDSEHTYTVRFAIKTLMTHFLDEDFAPEQLELVASVRSEEYYIRMAAAWYFATALAKQYDETVRLIQDRRMDKWTHNKTIQKAIESYRVSDEHKKYLRTLKM